MVLAKIILSNTAIVFLALCGNPSKAFVYVLNCPGKLKA